ncbi:MAG: quinol:cytochrome C oxidoreductase [Bacteroidota bacterium]|nr:quinol:cytochrome C oxidoreductase [Bacteroidota bacterium]
MNYIFTQKNKTIAFVLMAVGLISIIASFLTHNHQAWSNLLHNTFYFMAIALAGTFFLAIQYAAEAGWSVVLKRILEAMGQFLPWSAVLMLIVFFGNYIAGHSGGHYLYHWLHTELYDPASAEYDKIIAGKSGYLNLPFFIIRMLAYFAIWIGFTVIFRRLSLKEDIEGGTVNYFKAKRHAATFLVLFAVTSSTSAWDFIMSIDTHWYSTLFGWYTFAGMFISGLAVMNFILVYLVKKGNMPWITEHHLHDAGKFMFAFSIFWTYLWFAQFMLIWYANIPEEVTYFMIRFDSYKELFIANFMINFFTPFLLLMSRDAKRKLNLLLTISVILFIGHWIDVFLMITPGVVKENWHIGWMEIGTTLGFLGLFMYVVQNALTKAPLLREKHPLLQESLHHSI